MCIVSTHFFARIIKIIKGDVVRAWSGPDVFLSKVYISAGLLLRLLWSAHFKQYTTYQKIRTYVELMSKH